VLPSLKPDPTTRPLLDTAQVTFSGAHLASHSNQAFDAMEIDGCVDLDPDVVNAG
jgi:hypothetical protein